MSIVHRDSSESQQRSIIKTFTWRVIAEIDTFIISYLITGSAMWSISIVGVESITKLCLYYFHERIWGHLEM